MAQEYETLPNFLNHGFDAVIDVRSPAEFEEDHVPGAINLPVLSNAERAEVGTIYAQQSPFLAKKIGAALVFRNAAAHIENRLRDYDGSWRPLVYCWRGGQRSGSFAWMLAQIGWRSDLVDGGYRRYRRLVKSFLYDVTLPHKFVALDGYTGTAKTELLHLLKARGVQILDLEGLAGHRGSLLGQLATPQPSQKEFETKLAQSLSDLDPARPVLIEAESSKIGERIIPPSLWTAMKLAPRIHLSASIEARAAYLARAYDDVLSDSELMREKLGRLRAIRGNLIVDGWLDQIAAGDKPGLTRSLMLQHYDPAYNKSRKSVDARVLKQVEASELDAKNLKIVASRIEDILSKFV